MFRHHFRNHQSTKPIVISVALAVVVGLARMVMPVSSAPVTGTAVSKLTVYGGVTTIAPGASGDHIFELGNAGRDIAGSSDIFIRPGSLSTGTANFARFSAIATKTYLTVPGTVSANGLVTTAQDATNEGGEISLLPSSAAYHVWGIDLFTDRLRFHSNNGEKFTVTQAGYAGVGGAPNWVPGWPLEANSGTAATAVNSQITATGSSGSASRSAGYNIRIDATNVWQMLNDNSPSAGGHAQNSLYFQYNASAANRYLAIAPNGNVYVKNSFCFGDPNTSTNCSSNWAIGGSSNLDSVLAVGNTSSRSASLGTTAAPTAKLLVHNTESGAISGSSTGSAGDAIAVYANSTDSAFYGRQNGASPTSYGAYFSAVNVTGSAAAVGAWSGRAYVDASDIGHSQGVGFIASHEYRVPSGPQTGMSWSKAGQVIGDLEISQSNIAPSWPTWGLIGDLVKVQGNVLGTGITSNIGFPVSVFNDQDNGYAARFKGGVLIQGAPACTGFCIYAKAALDVRNTYSSGAGISSTAIMVSPGAGGIGLDAYGGATALQAVGSFGTTAAHFIGTTLFEGSAKTQQSVSNPQLEVATWIQLQGGTAQTCYQACGGFAVSDPLKETGQCLLAWRVWPGGVGSAGSTPTMYHCGNSAASIPANEVLRCLCR